MAGNKRQLFKACAAWILFLLSAEKAIVVATRATTQTSSAVQSYLNKKRLNFNSENAIENARLLLVKSLRANINTAELSPVNHEMIAKEVLEILQEEPRVLSDDSGCVEDRMDENLNINLFRALKVRRRRRRKKISNRGQNSSSSSKSKRKGGSKTSKGKRRGKKSAKGDHKSSKNKSKAPKICRRLNFHDWYGYSQVNEKSVYDTNYKKKTTRRKGVKGKRERELQFDGELCNPNILNIAATNPDFSILVDAIDAAGLDNVFLCAGPFTLLAPTNAAILKNPALLEYLLDHPAKLQEVLLYHIIPGFFFSDDLQEGKVESLLGEIIDVMLEPLMFNEAKVISPDVLACNGVIHALDDLLIPPDSGVLPEVCELLDFRQLDQLTSLAFVNRGNDRSTGDGILANGGRTSNVQPCTDRSYRGGVLNRRLQYEGELCDHNALSASRNNPYATIFNALIDAAGLSAIFLCAGPFTILAPSDDAMKALDPELIETLLLPENQDQLQELLLYHVVQGFYPSTSLVEGDLQTLLFNQTVMVSTNPMQFNQARVLQPDDFACNGVVHLIDEIIFPGEEKFCDDFIFDDFTVDQRRRLQDGGQDCELNVLATARDNPDLTTAVLLFEAAELDRIFDCAGPFTALLPTNAAFEALPQEILDVILDPENLSLLQDVLLKHILPGATFTSDFAAGSQETLLDGTTVEVDLDPLTFDDSNVVTPDIVACNGYINSIDAVLLT